jgi:hypothetical protein
MLSGSKASASVLGFGSKEVTLRSLSANPARVSEPSVSSGLTGAIRSVVGVVEPKVAGDEVSEGSGLVGGIIEESFEGGAVPGLCTGSTTSCVAFLPFLPFPLLPP